MGFSEGNMDAKFHQIRLLQQLKKTNMHFEVFYSV